MSARVIPLTPSGALWSQREYVRCMALNIEFACHRDGPIGQWFHYGFPDDIGCTSVQVTTTGVVRYVDHSFPRGLDWINRCRAAVTKD